MKKHEKAALQGGSSTHIKHHDNKTVIHDLFPVNVQKITDLGAGPRFHWRKSARDLIGPCPQCGGKLVIDEEFPNHVCLGDLRCEARSMSFTKLMTAISEESRRSHCFAAVGNSNQTGGIQ